MPRVPAVVPVPVLSVGAGRSWIGVIQLIHKKGTPQFYHKKTITERAMKMNALVLCCFAFVGKASSQTSLDEASSDRPNLNGAHFRFTVVEDDGWVNIDEDEDGNLEFSGYCIDLLKAISSGANFTFDLNPPSGFGSLCKHSEGGQSPTEPYGKEYRGQYLCGQSDVQDDTNYTISQNNYTTDFYQGLFYVTPERRLLNRFTTPFLPPSQGGMQLMGTATRIRGVEDLMKQQTKGKQGPACLQSNTAASLWIKRSFPDLKTVDVEVGDVGDVHKLLSDGTCDIMINANPKEMRVVKELSEEDLCQANGKPIGLIGDPLSFGFNQFAIGVNLDILTEVLDTIDYWMNHFMTCSPADVDCDSFAAYYPAVGGTGDECAYDNEPPIEDNWRIGVIVGVVASVALASLLLGWGAFYYYELLKQRKRIKKRFV
jgi:ABC-type amino acid transport substrate-binding protein